MGWARTWAFDLAWVGRRAHAQVKRLIGLGFHLATWARVLPSQTQRFQWFDLGSQPLLPTEGEQAPTKARFAPLKCEGWATSVDIGHNDAIARVERGARPCALGLLVRGHHVGAGDLPVGE